MRPAGHYTPRGISIQSTIAWFSAVVRLLRDDPVSFLQALACAGGVGRPLAPDAIHAFLDLTGLDFAPRILLLHALARKVHVVLVGTLEGGIHSLLEENPFLSFSI